MTLKSVFSYCCRSQTLALSLLKLNTPNSKRGPESCTTTTMESKTRDILQMLHSYTLRPIPFNEFIAELLLFCLHDGGQQMKHRDWCSSVVIAFMLALRWPHSGNILFRHCSHTPHQCITCHQGNQVYLWEWLQRWWLRFTVMICMYCTCKSWKLSPPSLWSIAVINVIGFKLQLFSCSFYTWRQAGIHLLKLLDERQRVHPKHITREGLSAAS